MLRFKMRKVEFVVAAGRRLVDNDENVLNRSQCRQQLAGSSVEDEDRAASSRSTLVSCAPDTQACYPWPRLVQGRVRRSARSVLSCFLQSQ